MTHKGFCRVAIDTGVPVVPIYCLGNTALFNVVGLKRLSRRFRVGLQLFWGRAFLPLPRQSKIVVVVRAALTANLQIRPPQWPAAAAPLPFVLPLNCVAQS